MPDEPTWIDLASVTAIEFRCSANLSKTVDDLHCLWSASLNVTSAPLNIFLSQPYHMHT